MMPTLAMPSRSGEPEEIRRMIVAQRPCRPRGKDVLDRLTPKIDEGRLCTRGELRASNIGHIPIEQQFDFDGKRIDVIDGNPVGLVAVDRQSVGKTRAVQMRERRERNGVALLDDAAFAGDRLAAEILDDGKPGGEIEGKDFGRREALLRASPCRPR